MTMSMGTAQTLQIELIAPKSDLAYFDQQSVQLGTLPTPLEAWSLIMRDPLPFVAIAFRIWAAISALFGVKQIGTFGDGVPSQVQVGDRLDFFTVETVNETVLSLSVRGCHMDVLTCVTSVAGMLTITSSVKAHDWFGRCFMVPVAPAHKLIVWAIMRRLKRKQG